MVLGRPTSSARPSQLFLGEGGRYGAPPLHKFWLIAHSSQLRDLYFSPQLTENHRHGARAALVPARTAAFRADGRTVTGTALSRGLPGCAPEPRTGIHRRAG